MTSFFTNQNQLQSKSSFYQSSVRLSVSALNQNIMIRQKFSSSFNQQIWDQISCVQPQRFLFKQRKILDLLLHNQEKFTTFFKTFYENHKKITDWCILANQKHLQIKQYLFTQLLKKPIMDYKIELRDNLVNKTKKSFKKDENYSQNKLFAISTNNSPTKEKSQSQKTETSPTSFHKSAIFRAQQQNPSEDYHELFIRTLDACEGSKYIHYDFRKHQKGYQNRSFYNNFIRFKNTDKQNRNENTLYQSFKGLPQSKMNLHQKLPNKMFSVVRLSNSISFNNFSSFSNFQILCLEEQQGCQKEKRAFKKKSSNKLVLKKMPHLFGNKKSASDFVIKTKKTFVQKLKEMNQQY